MTATDADVPPGSHRPAADPQYRFGVLGSLTVERDGEPLTLASGRQRTLLALLLAADQPIPRDRLIDQLWGERPPPSAVKALSVFLSRMRAALGDVVIHQAGGYLLAPGSYELDADRFRTLVARGRAEPVDGRELLREALALFRGEPLSDVDTDGVLAGWRRSLEQERLDAQIARIDLDLDAGIAAELVPELERLLDRHPYEERIWGQLMLVLARCGRRADALDAYQRVRRLFAYELGIEPGQPLAAIQMAILADEAGHGAETPDARRSDLPRPLGPLIGRTRELDQLSSALSEPEQRLLTLVGPGGVGKTRLALELAHRLEPGFAGGAVFIALEQLGDPELVTTEIAAALGGEESGISPAVDRLAAVLGARPTLLVVDNFEHLLAAALTVAQLLIAAPSLHVIATSRAPLRIRGEQLFEVEPLELPAGDSDDARRASPAVELFLELGRATDRNLAGDPQVARVSANICCRLDGLPLAIELAAAQLRVLTPEQIDASLERPLEFAGHGQVPRDLPDRHRTLEQAIRWSFDLLSMGAREVLLAAGVFRGGFTLESLGAVVGRDVETDLAELLDTSLVRRAGSGERFRMLELVRSFALAELADRGHLDATRARHRAHFAAVAGPLGTALDDGDPPGELAAELRAEHANLRAACDDALEQGDRDSALGLIGGMRALWYVGSLRAEGHGLLTRALDRFELEPADEMMLLRAGSFLDGVDAEMATRAPFTQRLAARAQELGDIAALCAAVSNLAALALNAQDRPAVAAVQPRLLELTGADVPPRFLAFVSYTLALAEYLEGDIATACEHCAQAVRLAAAAEHSYTLGSATGLQLMLHLIRDGEISRSDLADGLATIRLASVKPLAVVGLWLVARYAAAVDRDAAIRWLVAAEAIVSEIDTQIWPESDLRAETCAVLELPAGVPPRPEGEDADHVAALTAAADWLAARPDGEVILRDRR